MVEVAAATSILSFVCPDCGHDVAMDPAPADSSVSCSGCGKAFPVSEGIIMLGTLQDGDAYPEAFHDVLAKSEADHFWFGARNRIIMSTLGRHLGTLPGHVVVDIGCGTGFVTAALERAGMRVCGVDMNLAGLRHARRSVRAPLIRLDAERLPFRPYFDVALLCDVIEHVDEDEGLLRQAAASVRAGGLLLVTVPAMPSLWTSLDSASGHRRRYTRCSLIRALERADLRVREVRYFNSLLYPLLKLRALSIRDSSAATEAEHRLEIVRSAVIPPPALLNTMLSGLTRVELFLRPLSLPFGGSLVAVASPAR